MFRPAFLAVLAATAPSPSHALSNAAEYLVAQEVAAACDGGEGGVAGSAVIERDLTGDGRADLVIAHDGITCAGGGRSLYCGMQVCSVKVYVRRGALLEPEVEDLLGQMVTVGGGAVPEIRRYGHGGAPHSMRWDGRGFR